MDSRCHSTGGGQWCVISAVMGQERGEGGHHQRGAPLMVKTPANPLGLPKSVFDDLQSPARRQPGKFYYDLPAGPFYGFNRPA